MSQGQSLGRGLISRGSAARARVCSDRGARFASLAERVGRGAKYVVVDSFRNEREKVNLLYWQLTCQCFYTPEDWQWWFERTGYSGDHSFVCFE